MAKDATSTSSLAQIFLRKAATLSAILVTAVAAFVFFLNKVELFFFLNKTVQLCCILIEVEILY